jgi:hypothetical protein
MHHTMEAHERVELQIHSLLTSTSDYVSSLLHAVVTLLLEKEPLVSTGDMRRENSLLGNEYQFSDIQSLVDPLGSHMLWSLLQSQH